MADSENLLEQYIQQILKIQLEKNQTPLQVAELNQIAQNLGLTEADLRLIDQKFNDYLYRGQGFARYRNWDKAIEELNQAVILKPLHIEALYHLADACRWRFLEKGNIQDKNQALLYAERCLQSEAKHEGSLHLISQLSAIKPDTKSRELRYRRLIRALIVSILAVILGVFAWIMWQWMNQSPANSPNPIVYQINRFLNRSQADLPISILKSEQSAGLSLALENSFLRKTGKNYLYQLRACVLSEVFEINRLQLRLELLDAKGKVRYTEALDVLDEDDFEMRKGDAVPLTRLIQDAQITDDIFQARLVVMEIDNNAPPTVYEEARSLSQIKEKGVEIRERYQVIHPEPEVFRHEIVFEYQNLGKTPIKNLQIEVQWIDWQNRLLHNDILELLTPSEPMLATKQRRIKSKSFMVNVKKSELKEYKVFVLRCE
jgi:hypothetical protein